MSITKLFCPILVCAYRRKTHPCYMLPLAIPRLCLYFRFCLYLGATVADALSIGYRTILIDDCCRGVDLNDIEITRNSVIKDHGVIVQSNEVSTKTDNYFEFYWCWDHNNIRFFPVIRYSQFQQIRLLLLYSAKVRLAICIIVLHIPITSSTPCFRPLISQLLFILFIILICIIWLQI